MATTVEEESTIVTVPDTEAVPMDEADTEPDEEAGPKNTADGALEETTEPPEITESAAETGASGTAENGEQKEPDGVTIVIRGSGSVMLVDDVWCYEPAAGYELLSIQADQPILTYEAGEAIPESELAASAVPDGTTLTYVFAEETNRDGGPEDSIGKTFTDSSDARFDGVWDSDTLTVH